jgi:hypothetical protein
MRASTKVGTSGRGPCVLESPQVLENTSYQAVSRPVSAALSRPRFLILGGMGLPVRMAARLGTGFQHPAHPLPLENGNEWLSVAHQGA